MRDASSLRAWKSAASFEAFLRSLEHYGTMGYGLRYQYLLARILILFRLVIRRFVVQHTVPGYCMRRVPRLGPQSAHNTQS